MRLPTDACCTALARAGYRAAPSPTVLTAYWIHQIATEEWPGTFMGEMTEREIWAWLEKNAAAQAPGPAMGDASRKEP